MSGSRIVRLRTVTPTDVAPLIHVAASPGVGHGAAIARHLAEHPETEGAALAIFFPACEGNSVRHEWRG